MYNKTSHMCNEPILSGSCFLLNVSPPLQKKKKQKKPLNSWVFPILLCKMLTLELNFISTSDSAGFCCFSFGHRVLLPKLSLKHWGAGHTLTLKLKEN